MTLPDILEPIVLNQSGLKTYNNCNRLFAWIRLARLDTVMHRSAPEIGTAVHEGLRILHGQGGTPESALEAATAKLKERAGPSTRFEDKDLDEAQEIVDRVLPAYFQHWEGQNRLWTPIDQECQFLVEVIPGWWDTTFPADLKDVKTGAALRDAWNALPRSGVYLRGRADNLSIHAGGLWLVDYKTAAKNDPRELLKYELDFQLTGYIYGITRQLTMDAVEKNEEPIAVRGAIIDQLVKTAVPQFNRETFTRSNAELREFELEFVEYGSRIRSQKQRVRAGEDWKTVFPKNTEQCFRYGTCAMRDLCVKDTPIRRMAYATRGLDYVDESQDMLEAAQQQKQ